jgi:hypothetical protein
VRRRRWSPRRRQDGDCDARNYGQPKYAHDSPPDAYTEVDGLIVDDTLENDDLCRSSNSLDEKQVGEHPQVVVYI